MNWKALLVATACCAVASPLTSAATDQVPQTGGANSTNPNSSVASDNDNSTDSHANISTIVVTLMPANTTFMPVSGGADSTNPNGSSGSAGEVVDAPIARTISPTSAALSSRALSDVALVISIAAWLGSQALL